MTSTALSPADYSLRRIMLGLIVVQCLAFFTYLFLGRTLLPTVMIDTMTAPLNVQFHPPAAENISLFDALTQTYCYKTESQRSLREGTIAHWNPRIFGGYPQYAETMGNNYDPLNILLLWFDTKDVILWQTIIDLVIAGIGMSFLLRFLGISERVNFIFSAAFMLNSLFVASAEHRWLVASFCWAPFIIWLIVRYFHRGAFIDVLYASTFCALAFLGGNVQTSFFIVCVIALLVLLYPANVRWSLRLAIGGVIGIVAFLLSAMMWLPTLELLYQVLFQGGHIVSSSVSTPYSLLSRIATIPLFVNFLFPSLLSNTTIYSLKHFAGGAVDMIDFNGSLGFIPILFAAWGSFKLWKHRHVRPFIILSVIAVLVPWLTPLYHFVYYRILVVAVIGWTVIGAVAFQRVLDREMQPLKFIRATTVVYLTFFILFFAVSTFITIRADYVRSLLASHLHGSDAVFTAVDPEWYVHKLERTIAFFSLTSIGCWLPLVLALISLIVLGHYLRQKISKGILLSIIGACTILQVCSFAWVWFPATNPAQYPVWPSNPVTQYLKDHRENSRYVVYRDLGKDAYILPSNSSDVYGSNDFDGYESIRNRNMSGLYHTLVQPDRTDAALLGLSGVKYILTTSTLNDSHLKQVDSSTGVRIYENTLAVPRAFIAYRAKVLRSDSGVSHEMLEHPDPSVALFTNGEAPAITSFMPDTCTPVFEKNEDEDIQLNARTTSGGILILSDTYYPGWECYINGKATTIYRANYAMRAVLLPAGDSHIEFRFVPVIFRIGAWISGSSVTLCILAILIVKRKKRVS